MSCTFMFFKKSHSNTADVGVPFEAKHVLRYTSKPYCKKVTQLYRLHLFCVINISHTQWVCPAKLITDQYNKNRDKVVSMVQCKLQTHATNNSNTKIQRSVFQSSMKSEYTFHAVYWNMSFQLLSSEIYSQIPWSELKNCKAQ